MKSISIHVGLDKSRRPYVETVLGGRVRAGGDNLRVLAEPFEQTIIAPEKMWFRSIAKLIRE